MQGQTGSTSERVVRRFRGGVDPFHCHVDLPYGASLRHQIVDEAARRTGAARRLPHVACSRNPSCQANAIRAAAAVKKITSVTVMTHSGFVVSVLALTTGTSRNDFFMTSSLARVFVARRNDEGKSRIWPAKIIEA